MKRIYPVVAAVLTLCAASGASANNTFFLPGDAYFYTRLGSDEIEKLKGVDAPIFTYGSHWNGGFGCGFIGYQKLQILEIPAEVQAALKVAYEKFRSDISERDDLQGKMSVFIYSADYDWQKRGLGLQYNERWVDESVRFGFGRDHLRLESFVIAPNAIVRNWRDADLVSPLNAQCPVLPADHTQAWSKSPVEMEAKNAKLLIIPNRDFDDYVETFPEEGLEVIEIADGKLTHFVSVDRRWQAE